MQLIEAEQSGVTKNLILEVPEYKGFINALAFRAPEAGEYFLSQFGGTWYMIQASEAFPQNMSFFIMKRTKPCLTTV